MGSRIIASSTSICVSPVPRSITASRPGRHTIHCQVFRLRAICRPLMPLIYAVDSTTSEKMVRDDVGSSRIKIEFPWSLPASFPASQQRNTRPLTSISRSRRTWKRGATLWKMGRNTTTSRSAHTRTVLRRLGTHAQPTNPGARSQQRAHQRRRRRPRAGGTSPGRCALKKAIIR